MIKNTSEFVVKIIVLIIPDFQQTVFHPEGVLVIVVQWMTFNLDIPIVKVFTIKQLYPFFTRSVFMRISRKAACKNIVLQYKV